MERKNKKIVAGMMAGFCVLSTQTLVQYGLLVGNGGITAKHSPGLQAFGFFFDENMVEDQHQEELDAAREEHEEMEMNELEEEFNFLNIEYEYDDAYKNVGILNANNIYDGCEYELNDDTHEATLIKCISYVTEAIIPGFVEKNGERYTVTSIGDCAFNGCKSLKRLWIPQTVTSLGNHACRDCINLNTVNFEKESSLQRIGDYALYGCKSLKRLWIPQTVTSLGDNACRDCENLETLIFAKESSLQRIGESTFSGCIGLKRLEIPDKVTSLGNWAFAGCKNLKTLIFAKKSSLQRIGYATFKGCIGLTIVEIPDKIISLDGWTFDGCINLDTVIFKGSSSLGTIDGYTFNGCDKLQSIYIPKGAPCIKDLEAKGLGKKIKPLDYAENNASEESGFVQDTNNKENMDELCEN